MYCRSSFEDRDVEELFTDVRRQTIGRMKMIRNLKALGLALVAMFALTAAASTAAQAAVPVLTTEGAANVVLTGTQEGFNELVRGPRIVTCKKGHLTATGEVANGATEAEFTPSYSECHTNLGGPATVTNTGCKFRFKLAADAKEPEDTWTAISSLHCNDANSHIVVHAYINHEQHTNTPNAPSCQYTFTDWTNGLATQHNQNLTTLDITNKAANPPVTEKNYLELHLGVENIVSTRTLGSALLCGVATHTEGKLVGTGHVKASSGGKPAGITISTK